MQAQQPPTRQNRPNSRRSQAVGPPEAPQVDASSAAPNTTKPLQLAGPSGVLHAGRVMNRCGAWHTRSVRRVFIIFAAIVGLVAASCGADSVVAVTDPTPVPAPTVAGRVIEVEPPEIRVETVLIGISSTDTIMLHALPGIDQPLAGDVPPGTSIEPLNNAFETDDGLVWWQVRAGALNGWIQPSIAYRGPSDNITDQVVDAAAAQGPFETAEDAARAVAAQVAPGLGAPEIVVVSANENASGTSVTVDLLGLQDDSLLGYRLIVGTSGSAWQPASVFQSKLCARGVTAEGLCL